MAKDYKQIAADIIANAGGVENIISASHCMTRLRVQVKDASKVDEEAAKSKKVPGVINLIVQNGEFQYVIGQDVPTVYEEITKVEGIATGGAVDDQEALKEDAAAVKEIVN
ncbi:MAG: PTS transporter subunit EIIB [Oscillospiraceae bacterium]|nr:PTS transporter subunit EIIB [Oscillospiraceae bacterium]